MIRWPDRPRAPAARLLEGVPVGAGAPVTMVIGFDADLEPDSIAERVRGADRLLAIGWLGTHRDAREPELRRQWDLEEAARATRLPTLALRLGPLIGPASPLWRVLAAGARGLDRNRLMMPVVESDAVETLRRALADAEPWSDWYEVAGPETATVGELVDWAASARAGAGGAEGGGNEGPAEWEPTPAILRAQRLADPTLWLERFRIAPPPLAERIGAWRR